MISIEDTQVKVGNVVLPGLFKSMEVTHEVEIDEQEVEGSSKRKKQITGYGDAKISIELILEVGVYETAEYKLQKLQNIFKKPDQGKPIVYNIISAHLAARNISKVIFKGLSSKEDNSKSRITATLEFLEFDVMTVTATKNVATSTEAVNSRGDSVQKNVSNFKGSTPASRGAQIATTIGKRSSTYQRGTAPKLSEKKKTAKSPAKDNTKAGEALCNQVRKLSSGGR